MAKDVDPGGFREIIDRHAFDHCLPARLPLRLNFAGPVLGDADVEKTPDGLRVTMRGTTAVIPAGRIETGGTVAVHAGPIDVQSFTITDAGRESVGTLVTRTTGEGHDDPHFFVGQCACLCPFCAAGVEDDEEEVTAVRCICPDCADCEDREDDHG